ncbi:hypothetical protein O181_043065 [Austropuccinia psidii MF-1]|uniref:Uncharacterized protein n=1 Tax=Austropuccinia psidii MF-1 TaxID=1389203 RepID=A0A9Q3HIS9_9BASI|nr:hypothetical protein [Austropuccinia psidii MF-1]
MAFWGHLGPLRLLRPVGQSGPFWPNPMRPKGANHLASKARWVPPEPILAINPMDTKMAIEPVGPNFGHGPPWTIFPALTSGNHQRPPNQLSKQSPQLKGNSSIPPCTPYSRLQEWCKYGIIYHYAPFLLSNSMVTFSGPNSTFPNQGPKIQHPFQRRIL